MLLGKGDGKLSGSRAGSRRQELKVASASGDILCAKAALRGAFSSEGEHGFAAARGTI